MTNQIKDQTIQNIADAIEYLSENSIGNLQGTCGYSVADSIENIAINFERWVNLQEKIHEEKK